MSDAIYQLQKDVTGRLESHAYCSDIPVLLYEKGVILEDIEEALKLFTVKSGKKGAAIVVSRAIRTVPQADPSGPRFDIIIPVGVFEWPMLNRTSTGTGKVIEEIVSEVCHLIHGWRPYPIATQIYCDKDAVSPIVGDDKVIASEIRFAAKLGLAAPVRVSMPLFSGNANAVQITCNTPSATIYYTLDGSFPWSGNAEATLHDGNAFTVSSGTTVRASAFKTNYQASDIAAQTF